MTEIKEKAVEQNPDLQTQEDKLNACIEKKREEYGVPDEEKIELVRQLENETLTAFQGYGTN